MTCTYDTEEKRIIDKIKCIAFRKAKDAGTEFIHRYWVTNEMHMTNVLLIVQMSVASLNDRKPMINKKICSVVVKWIAEKQKRTCRSKNN